MLRYQLSYFYFALQIGFVSCLIEHAYNSLKKEKHFLEALLLRQVSYFPLSCLTALYLNVIEHGLRAVQKR